MKKKTKKTMKKTIKKTTKKTTKKTQKQKQKFCNETFCKNRTKRIFGFVENVPSRIKKKFIKFCKKDFCNVGCKGIDPSYKGIHPMPKSIEKRYKDKGALSICEPFIPGGTLEYFSKP